MPIRDRIKQLRRVKASDLRPNPKNWRLHPARQRQALKAVLGEIGYADAVLARELPDGSLMLIDGHLRAEVTPDTQIPVLILDVDEAEADKILATHDPLAALAETDAAALGHLLSQITTEDQALQTVLDQLSTGKDQAATVTGPSDKVEIEIPESYQVVVDCSGEPQQQDLYERLTGEGFSCRLLTL